MKVIQKKQLGLLGMVDCLGLETQMENILQLLVARELEQVFGGQIKTICTMKLIVCLLV